MARWMKPSEETPDVTVGDRIAIIVMERAAPGSPIGPRLVILEAIEDGWHSPDPTYAGYSVDDAFLWATESSVCAIAHAID